MHAFPRALFLVPAFASAVLAQSWTFPMSPRATYLRTNQDSPLPPVVVDLAALGLAPGQWLRIGSTGAFRHITGGQDNSRALSAVFSGSAALLPANVQQRVVDAIAAGPDFLSGPTYHGSLPTDVPQDFFCSRTGWDDRIDVQVPAGATHLFLGTHDSLFNDNVDPNGDWGAVVTLLPPPLLPGTGEHLVLRSAVDGVPAAAPVVHVAPPGSTLLVELGYPLGLLDGEIYALIADVAPTGGPLPNPLPGLWSWNLILLQAGILPPIPGWTDSWSMVATADFPGTTVIVQGAALSARARNGVFVSTAAHAFLFP
ncbi:MAG: hypothetical protein KF830_17030 [Planctomycetes bacterium]|nr:hypothetical protein [Planctomycetota bacterium]